MTLSGKTPVLRTGKTILSTKNNDNQIIKTTITTYNNIIEVSSMVFTPPPLRISPVSRGRATANLQNWR